MVALVFSVVSGVLAHLVFYPMVKSWHNQRFKLLARPAIGVATASPVFAAWVVALYRAMTTDDNKLTEWQVVLIAMSAYCTAFLLHGGGVAAGYVIDDLMDNPT
jgi:hypothetical protein